MKNNLKNKLSWIFGVSLCNNIFYIFNKNNFYFNISNLISLIVVLYVFFNERNKIMKNLKKIDYSFILYIVVSLLSLIPALITFKGDIDILSSYFNGIPSLILLFVEYYAIVSLDDNVDNFINGIKVGFIINVIISFIQYIYFINDKVFSLFYFLFPQHSFQVCGKFYILYGMKTITTSLKVYFYRAQGLFVETSYFTSFIVGSGLISFSRFKNKFFKFCFILTLSFLCIISESGNFFILIGIWVMYLIIKAFKHNNGKLLRKNILIIPCILFSVFIVSLYCLNDKEIMYKVNKTVLSTNISDSGNDSRKKTIDEGIELLNKYPLGIGYNMTTKIFSREYPMEKHSYIFSTFIVNELELGLLGNIVYLIFALKFIIKIIIHSSKKEDILIALSTFGLFICQMSNGINYWNIQFILGMYALSNVIYNRLKKEKSTVIA